MAERYLRRSRAKHTWRRRRADDNYDDDDDDDEYTAQARSIALEGRYLEHVVAVEKSQIPIFKFLERRRHGGVPRGVSE